RFTYTRAGRTSPPRTWMRRCEKDSPDSKREMEKSREEPICRSTMQRALTAVPGLTAHHVREHETLGRGRARGALTRDVLNRIGACYRTRHGTPARRSGVHCRLGRNHG